MSNGTMINVGTLQLPDCNGRPTCDPVPVCPACGGLECLCRPRFFAGQLLTEEDLNRLDHYIVAKNRLHNRYLHGWGVVCGLEVVCEACGPDQRSVIVKPGYALSPCGNDVVVCKTEKVDVCDLIDRCRPSDDCADLFSQPPTTPSPPPPAIAAVPGAVSEPPDCGGTEEWVLAICYTEKPSRGMANLRAHVPECGCGCGYGGTGGSCGCGGKKSKSHHHDHTGDCGCGCHGGKAKKRPASPRTVPEQCEPTVICEGYKFAVYKAPKKSETATALGAAARRFLCCLAPLLKELEQISQPGTQPTPQQPTPQQAQAWVYAFYEAVREFVINEGLYDCQIAQRLAAVAIPKVGGDPADTALPALNQSAAAIATIAFLVLQKCLCAALLPPCPDPAQSDCVPLATITVTRRQCRVLRICNISSRRFLVTFPNIGYWLSFLNLSGLHALRELLERLCCRPLLQVGDTLSSADYVRAAPAASAVKAKKATKAAGAAAEAKGAFASLFWSAVAEPDRAVGVEHLLLGALDARDAHGQPFATPEALAYPADAVVLGQVIAPLVRQMIPAGAPITEALGGARIDTLSREVSDLRATVDKQQKTINELKRRK